ncbi:MAG: glycosyltransferase family 4 protein [Thermodesulfobacteriota bacterium]|nr:glycosyltransferase family 4 protein [Thermodesulfobacteriota bacterium]
MNILLLDLGSAMRGGQRQVFYLARRLGADPEFNPVLAAPAGSPLVASARSEGIKTHPLPSRWDWDPRNLSSLFGMVKKERIHLVHTHDARSASLGAAVKCLCAGVGLLHTRRVSYPLRNGWGRKKYRLADKIAAVSQEIADVLTDCGIDPAKIVVIHSGIDASRYEAGTRTQAREEIVFGLIGALSPQKGHAVFLSALALLRQEAGALSWKALIIGEGPLEAELQARTKELGLSDLVEFTGYRESREALLDLDVLAVPSVDGEGSNAVIKEGWAARIPVVASDLASNLELVEPEVSGLVFPNRDAAALKDALSRLARDVSLRQKIIQGGAERVGLFTEEITAEAYMRLYRTFS